MTPDDLKVRDWIVRYMQLNEGIAPTQAEIAEGMGLHRRQVETSLNRLEGGGKIRRGGRHRRRSIQVVGKATHGSVALETRVRELELEVSRLRRLFEPEAAE